MVMKVFQILLKKLCMEIRGNKKTAKIFFHLDNRIPQIKL